MVKRPTKDQIASSQHRSTHSSLHLQRAAMCTVWLKAAALKVGNPAAAAAAPETLLDTQVLQPQPSLFIERSGGGPSAICV